MLLFKEQELESSCVCNASALTKGPELYSCFGLRSDSLPWNCVHVAWMMLRVGETPEHSFRPTRGLSSKKAKET